jgi:hypothetical protein
MTSKVDSESVAGFTPRPLQPTRDAYTLAA